MKKTREKKKERCQDRETPLLLGKERAFIEKEDERGGRLHTIDVSVFFFAQRNKPTNSAPGQTSAGSM
jgi:hypothetical protein